MRAHRGGSLQLIRFSNICPGKKLKKVALIMKTRLRSKVFSLEKTLVGFEFVEK